MVFIRLGKALRTNSEFFDAIYKANLFYKTIKVNPSFKKGKSVPVSITEHLKSGQSKGNKGNSFNFGPGLSLKPLKKENKLKVNIFITLNLKN